jgi:uncharacterized protein (DUF1800 family)
MDTKDVVGVIAVASALAACGSDNNNNDDNNNEAAVKPSTRAEAARFLLQVQFDTNEEEITALMAGTFAGYLAARFADPLSETGVAWLTRKGYDAYDSYQYYYNGYPMDRMIWAQLITAPDRFRKKMALALSEFFVVSLAGISGRAWMSQAMASWWDMLNAKCFTTYREILGAVTLHPAMGYYLNMAGSKKETAAGRQPDENYAREILQLFSIGLYQLNQDGSEKTDGSGNKIETYKQSDIVDLAKILSGWDVVRTYPPGITIPDVWWTTTPMAFTASNHSTSAISFLGVSVSNDGVAALNTVLDTIANHPNVAPFFCKQMIQRLVTSNPSRQYVGRVAAVFNNNGKGVRGDLKAVFSAILLDSEARNMANMRNPQFGKIREPMYRFIQWARTFKIKSKYGWWQISNLTTALGQSPLRAPSVFNFFRPGYVPPNTQLADLKLVAPELQIADETSAARYLNAIVTWFRYGFYVDLFDGPQSRPGAEQTPAYDMAPDYSAFMSSVTNSTELVERLDTVLNYGQTTSENKQLIVSAIDALGVTSVSNSTDAAKHVKVSAAVYLMMACADYIVQK